MTIISKIKERYKSWKEYRFLKKHGCSSWKEYNKQNDPDVLYRASKVKDFYHGYPYVYCCERDDHPVYNYGPGFSIGIEHIAEWAETALNDKWRYDAFRVYKQTGIGLDGSHSPEWHFNDLGGGDYYFFAFKNEQDYLWFLMKWA